ncbi:MAG: hypothetical protein AAGJ85_05350, partial [Pseudomonadota bacterium]
RRLRMTKIDPQSGTVERHLQAGETILWIHQKGRLPTQRRLLLWAAIPLVLVWLLLGLRESFGAWEPDNVPLAIKLLVAIIFIGWAGLVVWCIRHDLRRDGNLIFVVTDRRVLVINPKVDRDIQQAKLDSLGNISVGTDRHGETLAFESASYFHVNPFFQNASKWCGLSDANDVKLLIEKLKAESS